MIQKFKDKNVTLDNTTCSVCFPIPQQQWFTISYNDWKKSWNAVISLELKKKKTKQKSETINK